jgi:Flp pilus assembly protein TadG
MRSIIELPRKLKSFQKDERGAIAIIFGMALVPVIFFSGIAIDYGRASHAKTVLQAAADAAVVAASNSSGTDAEKMQLAANVFAANAGGSGQTPTLSTNNTTGVVSFTTNTRWGNSTATVSVTSTNITVKPIVQVPTVFMRIAMVNSIQADAQSNATGSAKKKLEVAMMIDLTGSMGQNDRATSNPQPKINGLKTASADFLNIMFPNGATTSATTRVAIVPFADYVNAGTLAHAVTGLPDSGGTSNLYSKVNNLAQTKQGNFTGTYTGNFATLSTAAKASSGGQCGAQSSYQQSGATAPTSTTSATFTSTFTTNCVANAAAVAAGGGTPTTVAMTMNSAGTTPIGVYLDKEDGGTPDSTSVINSGQRQPVKHNGTAFINDGSTSNSKYFIPIPVSTTGLTIKKHASSGRNYGIKIDCSGCSTSSPPAGIKYGAFQKAKKVDNGKTDHLESDNATDFYVPIYTSLTTAGSAGPTADPQCTTTVDQPNGTLISCVTERSGSEAYTGIDPASGRYVGAYNQGGSSTKQNYSSDGKCWVAGRELPKVIPLTNNKATLTNFFDTCSVGGATPGHIGTAWAWYMIAPEWSTIFPASSAPAAYADTNTIKAVVLMTDGEYNVHYASETAKVQAETLCTNMKAKGIVVYTIGFGFPSDAAQDSQQEINARSLLKTCATNQSTTAFFPYDGNKLKEAFKSIGDSLNALTLSDIKISAN